MRPFFAANTRFSLLILSLAAAFLCLRADRDAQLLISFKSSLPNPSLLQNWLPNQNPCFFSGVTCQQSRVSSVDFSSILISADFSSVARSLLSLENLESLSLVNCNISGSIAFPPGSKCISALTSLDLSHNALSGPVSTVSNLGSCSNLKMVNLSSNFLDFSGKATKGLQLNLERFKAEAEKRSERR